MIPKWLEWARKIQAIAQTGLYYGNDVYDRERYTELKELSEEIVADVSSLDLQTAKGLYADERGYATPKVDVRGVAFRDDRILLVKERQDGKWTLPGGWADIGESPSQCVVKEVKQESGFEVEAVKLLMALDRDLHDHPPCGFHIYKLYFLCDITGGEATVDYETTEVGFFARDALPELSVSRVTEKQIHRCFHHYQNPGLATDFD